MMDDLTPDQRVRLNLVFSNQSDKDKVTIATQARLNTICRVANRFKYSWMFNPKRIVLLYRKILNHIECLEEREEKLLKTVDLSYVDSCVYLEDRENSVKNPLYSGSFFVFTEDNRFDEIDLFEARVPESGTEIITGIPTVLAQELVPVVKRAVLLDTKIAFYKDFLELFYDFVWTVVYFNTVAPEERINPLLMYVKLEGNSFALLAEQDMYFDDQLVGLDLSGYQGQRSTDGTG